MEKNICIENNKTFYYLCSAAVVLFAQRHVFSECGVLEEKMYLCWSNGVVSCYMYLSCKTVNYIYKSYIYLAFKAIARQKHLLFKCCFRKSVLFYFGLFQVYTPLLSWSVQSVITPWIVLPFHYRGSPGRTLFLMLAQACLCGQGEAYKGTQLV